MLFCHLCNLKFDTAEDISLHTCVEIKQEYVDAKLLDNYDVGQNGAHHLSEEFLSEILRLLDELCEVINSGDPDLERTVKVNKDLNEAVTCYRNKLIDTKIHVEDNWDEVECSKNDSDNDYKPKIENKAKKKIAKKVTKLKLSRPEKPKTDSRDIDHIEINPKFKNAKNSRNPHDIFLYPYVKYISETELQCLFCHAYTHKKKNQGFSQIYPLNLYCEKWPKMVKFMRVGK